MKGCLLGLWFCLVWAQTGHLVWDWHGEAHAGQGYHQPGEASQVYLRRFHTMRMMGDTLCVLGRVCIPVGDTAFLPNPGGAPIQLQIPNVPYRREASYIALYHRVSGAFLGALIAYAQLVEEYAVRYVDFTFSEDGDTIWIAVDFPTGGCTGRQASVVATPEVRWQFPSGAFQSLTLIGPSYSMNSNQYTAQVWQLSGLRNLPPAGWNLLRETFYWSGTGQYSLGLHGIVYRRGEVFVSGTIRLPTGASAASLYPAVLSAAYGPGGGDPSGNPACAFWVKLATGPAFGAVAASIFHRDGGGTNVQAYGRALLFKGDTLLALFNVRRDAPSDAQMSYKAFAGGPLANYSYLVQHNACTNNMTGHVYLLAFRASDLRPVSTSSVASSLYQLFCGDYSFIPSVGTLYPMLSGDTLWLAWNDARSLSISPLSTLRGLFAYWTGINSFPALSLGFGMPWVANNIFWTGLTRTSDGIFLLSGRNSAGEAVIGLHSPSAATHISLLRPINPAHAIEATGIISDPYGHLYLFGTGRTTAFEYERVRPRAVRDTAALGDLSGTIHATDKLGYGRAWIGRLLQYRAELIAGALPTSTCAPDTINRLLTFRLYGRFDAPSDSLSFRWNSGFFSYNSLSGPARWALAALLPPPGGIDTVSVVLPESPMLGRFKNGTYFLELGIAGWRESSNLLLVSNPALTISVNGDKAPTIYALESQRYWIYPFAGAPAASQGWRQASAAGDFQVKTAYLDGDASVPPHYAFAYMPYHPVLQKELLYVAINYADSVILYAVDVATGWGRRERAWPRLEDPSPYRPDGAVSPDTIVYGIQQLVWNPQRGALLAVEGGHRIRTIFPYPYSHLDFVFPTRMWGLPMGNMSISSSPMIVSTDPGGAAFWTGMDGTMNAFVFRDAGAPFHDFYANQWQNYTFCMGSGGGGGKAIASVRGMVVGATSSDLYFLDWGLPADPLNPGGCLTGPYQLRLRYSNGWSITDLDTLYQSLSASDMDSVRVSMIYRTVPAPHLIFPLRLPSGEGYILRYWLDGRPKKRDTLVGGVLVGDWSCTYSIDRWSPQTLPLAISLEVTRGGMMLYSASPREIRAAIPLYIDRTLQPDTARWLTEVPILQAVGGRDVALSWVGDTLRWAIDSLRSLRDSLTLSVRISPCGGRWPLSHRAVVLPSSPGSMDAPSLICQGEIFPLFGTLPSNDALLLAYLSSFFDEPVECGVRKLVEEIFIMGNPSVIPAGRAQRLSNGLWVALDTCDAIPCQAQSGLPAGLAPDYNLLLSLVESPSPITFRIRRGHYVKVTAAIEGATRADGKLSPHPAFSRLGLYRAATGNAVGDSLSEWGILGKLPPYWETYHVAWKRTQGFPLSWDTLNHPAPWYTPTWVSPVLVLLRENPVGAAVDSVWGFIDTLGRIWKWAPPMVDTTDCPTCTDRAHFQPWRLSFCRCDLTLPKWVILRFPQHLPLRSAQAIHLSQEPASPTELDFRDPTYLDGIPGENYAIVPSGGAYQAASWAGNCADGFHGHWPGVPQPPDWGVINAADYEFILYRNGITGPSLFSPADIDCDGDVDAADMLKVIENQNALRQSTVSD